MHFLHLTLLYCMLTLLSSGPAMESPPSPAKGLSITANPATATNIIYQSRDGGQTWEDVSYSLPGNELPEGFFAGASEIYLRTNGEMYRSKSNLKTPVWEKENVIDQQSNIAFNRSGVMAYSYDGKIYQKKHSSDPDNNRDWLPIYTNLESHSVATFFEASDGTVFLSTGKNFFKSTDKARNWKLAQNGWVGDIVESDGVLLAAGQKGIMRSTDQGEHWEWVISEGGVGIAIERIEGGFAAISYNASLKSRRIHISMDSGKTWQPVDGLPPSASISSIKQVGKYLLCGHPEGIFRSADKGKSWYLVHAGVENKIRIGNVWNSVPLNDQRKVFAIYVSGYVAYAVAKEGGC